MKILKNYLFPQIILVLSRKSLTTFLGIIFLGFLLPLFFNIYLFNGKEPLPIAFATYVSSGILSTLILCVSLKFPLLGYIILPLITLFSFISYYLKSVFGIFISYEVIASILETNYTEASSYITMGNITLIFGIFSVLFFFIYKGHSLWGRQISFLHLAGLLLFYLLISFIIKKHNPLWKEYRAYSQDYYTGARYWPWIDTQMYLKKIKEYRLHKGGAYVSTMGLPPLTSKPSSCLLSKDEDITIILHIGESVRADHLSINGYARDTTPLLKKRSSNIVSFPHNHAFGTLTRVSTIGILTDAECSHRVPHYSSFFDIFNHYSYATISLLSLQDNVHDLPLRKLSSRCTQHDKIPPPSDQSSHLFCSTVETFDKIHSKLKEKRQLFLLYDTGAHIPFTSLTQNKRWKPDSYDNKKPLTTIPEVINAYDNTLLEIDWEINEIITRIEHKTSLYIYIADHGVSLGENNQFGAGHISYPVINSAFFIWLSDSFIKKYPAIHAALKMNSLKKVSHDSLFHTILSLGGISSSAQKSKLDLTNKDIPDFIPMKHPHQMLQGNNDK